MADLWAAFMDVDGVEELGAEPLPTTWLHRLGRRWPSWSAAGAAAARGSGGCCSERSSATTAKNRPLPRAPGPVGARAAREAYYREDAYAEVRAAYVAHVAPMLRLVVEPDPERGRRPGDGARDRALASGLVDDRGQPRRPEDLQQATR